MTTATLSTPRDIALAFVDNINKHDVEGLCALMSDNHRFIDSLGVEVRGREPMRKAWLGYFHMIPDFAIKVQCALSDGPTVAIFGRSGGTFAPDGALLQRNRWSMPSAWRAVIHEGSVSEWQVYADNEPVRQLMNHISR